jgi:hypothetical protein
MELFDLFNSLEKPEIESGMGRYFSVVSIPGNNNIKIGKDIDETPCVLIKSNIDSRGDFIAPIFLENLSIEFNLECIVHQQVGNKERSKFTVVICYDLDPFIIKYFFIIMVSVIEMIGEKPADIEIYNALNAVVDLFRGLTQPPKKSVQGLWSELFIISRSSSPITLLDAWHSSPDDRYDFNSNNMRIEVKSSSQRVRKHHFSLEQLNPPPNTYLLVASIFVERSGGGISISDLTLRIREKVVNEPKWILYMDTIISQTLGISLRNGLSERFDYELAVSSLAFFDYNVIPSIKSKLPIEVSNVHFISDISGKPIVNIQVFRSLGGIFESVLK